MTERSSLLAFIEAVAPDGLKPIPAWQQDVIRQLDEVGDSDEITRRFIAGSAHRAVRRSSPAWSTTTSLP